ncbi:lisH and WD40 domain-containing protein mahjong [Arctopsyche grandis]|uniref:lisH and WD40 domain-containing protein mahjong n=1 Tax=Arctopsyche grandis TaxID=121162 RepID=UPI00406D9F76
MGRKCEARRGGGKQRNTAFDSASCVRGGGSSRDDLSSYSCLACFVSRVSCVLPFVALRCVAVTLRCTCYSLFSVCRLSRARSLVRGGVGVGAGWGGVMEAAAEVTDLLRVWEEQHAVANYDPVPALTRLAEIIEAETENFMKKDPDPFDERHPSRTDPSCALGMALKVMFKKDSFMTKLVNDYVRDTYYSRQSIASKDVRKLNIAACRLTLDLMPGLEMSVVFQDNEGFIHRLFTWAESSTEPLQTYATGLLAAAMEVQEIAAGFREQNARLVPLMLQRLHRLRKKTLQENQSSSASQKNQATQTRHFARFAQCPHPTPEKESASRKRSHANDGTVSDEETYSTPVKRAPSEEPGFNTSVTSPIPEGMMSPPTRGLIKQIPKAPPIPTDSTSNSSWAEMESYVIGNIQIYPPTDATRQMLILRYLTPMGEYQEFLSHVFSENALELILAYVNLRESRDSRLAFEALKYLAALLCHKKFSIEFINMNGLQRFLEVPRPSVAATGVSICMYYLAYCEDAMERVCLLPRKVLADLVRYALWLLECSHDSGRCHATMFFGFSFQFRVILEEFDAQDGLRKLYNLISTLPILSVEDDNNISDDESCAARQIVRHVCVALKKYLESHLYHKAAALRRQGRPGEVPPEQPPYKACKSSPDEIQEQIERLQSAVWTRWFPCDQFLRLGGVTLLLQIVAFSYDWNFNGRAETVRSALDVISVCCVAPRAQLLLCEKVDMPDEGVTVGLNIVLGAAEGEIVADADVQKAALNVLVNCICAPVNRVAGSSARFSLTGSMKKKTNMKSYEDVIQKVWECARTNNGIMVLLQLMLVKSPITDADCIRGLACRALAGLARCPTVRQIISKLPLFTTGQIQSLMRDPILQEKRQEHVMFQKYALELMERVSGKTKPSGAEFETKFETLANIHRANVVAQTHITFNERQLFQLIHQHLLSKGLTNTAESLQKEADLLPLPLPPPPTAPAPPIVYQPATPTRTRLSTQNRNSTPLNQSEIVSHQSIPLINGNSTFEEIVPLQQPLTTPIKIRRCQSTSAANTTPMTSTSTASILERRSLQKAPHVSHLAPPSQSTTPATTPRVTLDTIITEYLTNQHALCKNPMVTCPQFNLFEPHKCPDGLGSRRIAATNVAVRLARRQAGFGTGGRLLDARLLHSSFRSVQTFRLADEDTHFTCCIFHPTQQTLLAGTSAGDVKLFNLFSGQEESFYQLHDSYIHHMQANREGTLLLASSSTWRPLSALWNMKHYEMQLSLNEEEYVEFSNVEDKIIGTKAETATIYDVTTGRSIVTLQPSLSNQYTKNRATFNPTDELVLSDGVLWDLNSGKQIHKFDKLNQSLSGVFHPNGLEIISNTEVWDLRTFHLLRTVPTLDKSEVLFSPLCSVIYSVTMDHEVEDKNQYESNFKTLDAYDYSSIATIDVKRNIVSLSVARTGSQLALVENVGDYENVQESVVKLYDVGRRRDREDEVEDEEEDDLATDNDVSDSENEVDADILRNVLNGLGIDGNNSDDLDNNTDDDDDDDDDSFGDNDDGPDDDDDGGWRPRNRNAPRRRTRSRRRRRGASEPTPSVDAASNSDNRRSRNDADYDDADGDGDGDDDSEISILDLD